jgi:uracil-DNA glycosylase family 4
MVDPDRECPLCPRLVGFRDEARAKYPDWHNAPVISFGAVDPRLLVIGLAPGLRGANRTGRPFTGDFAGDLLYGTLASFGFTRGTYAESADDGLSLVDCLITNAVRCVPPQNKPTPAEIKTCRSFLAATLASQPQLRAVVALGRIAHESLIRTLGLKIADFPFAHGREHLLPGNSSRTMTLFDSYHCSRYNTNTGILTAEMFQDVFAAARKFIDA